MSHGRGGGKGKAGMIPGQLSQTYLSMNTKYLLQQQESMKITADSQVYT